MFKAIYKLCHAALSSGHAIFGDSSSTYTRAFFALTSRGFYVTFKSTTTSSRLLSPTNDCPYVYVRCINCFFTTCSGYSKFRLQLFFYIMFKVYVSMNGNCTDSGVLIIWECSRELQIKNLCFVVIIRFTWILMNWILWTTVATTGKMTNLHERFLHGSFQNWRTIQAPTYLEKKIDIQYCPVLKKTR